MQVSPTAMLKQQLHIFFNALTFFTRIPPPRWVVFNENYLNRAAAYFPLVGAIVGGFAALVFWGMLQILPVNIAVLCAIAASAWLTGCFHEDGFGDVCDGFGAGWNRDQILTIMKDSRLGTYGVVGLLLLLLLKFQALLALPIEMLPWLMVAAHVTSRWSTVLLITWGEYAKADQESKAKPLATRLGFAGLSFATACVAVVLRPGGLLLAVLLIGISVITAVLAYRWFKKKIGGYTGDCLGALQQVSELMCYLIAVMAVHGTLPLTAPTA
jgi:adenosylcobinamide-GDP ribazoletransferase